MDLSPPLKFEPVYFYTSQPSSIIRVSFPYSLMRSDRRGAQRRGPRLTLTIRKRLSTRVPSYTAANAKGQEK
jgi:hypothetical protein